MLLGVLSDTHSLLRPQAVAALRGVDHILHAGDVGDPEILTRLAAIAPVTAIRGNIDHTGPCAELPETETLELAGRFLHMVHVIDDLYLNPQAAGIHAVIYGHSHKAKIETKNGVLYLNPGSAGPRRFSLPVTLAHLHLDPQGMRAEIVPLLISR